MKRINIYEFEIIFERIQLVIEYHKETNQLIENILENSSILIPIFIERFCNLKIIE